MLVDPPFNHNSFKNANFAIIVMAFYLHRTKRDRRERYARRTVATRRQNRGVLNNP